MSGEEMLSHYVANVEQEEKGQPKTTTAVNFPEELATYDSNLSVLLNTFPYSVDDESRDTVGSDTFLQADLLDIAQTPDIGKLELQPSPKVRRQAPSSLPNTTEEITDRNVTRVTRPEDVALPSIERTTQPQRLEDIVNLPEQVVAETSTTAQTGNIPSAQAANALYAPQLKPPINRVLARAAASDSETPKTTATPNEISSHPSDVNQDVRSVGPSG